MSHRLLFRLFLTGFFVLTATITPFCAEQADKNFGSQQISTEIRHGYRDIKSFSREQRDEAVSSARRELRDLDRNIERLQSDLDQQWDSMNETTRRETRQALAALRRLRNEVSQWLGGLRYSSKETWEEVKQGFNDSLGDLKHAFSEMRGRFSSSE